MFTGPCVTTTENPSHCSLSTQQLRPGNHSENQICVFASTRLSDMSTSVASPSPSYAEQLIDKIDKKRLESTDYRHFVPDIFLKGLLDRKLVENVILEAEIPTDDICSVVDYVLERARKLFCILVYNEHTEFIHEFKTMDVTDESLPIEKGFKWPRKMKPRNIKKFEEDWQWEYLSPILDESYQEPNDRSILPFHTDKAISDAKGGFGEIHRVQIYAVHQKLIPVEISLETEPPPTVCPRIYIYGVITF